MMNTQQLTHLARLSGPAARSLPAGHALALGTSGGELEVLAGRVWLTREGELDDHLVEAGQSLLIAASGGAVIEAWDDERPALVAWRPRRPLQRFVAAWRAAGARAVSAFLHNRRHESGLCSERARHAAQEARRCTAGAA